jgi:transmembrane sensor
MQRARWKYLLNRFYDQTASAEERADLMAALRAGEEPEEALMDELMAKHTAVQALPPAAAEVLYQQILTQLPSTKTRVRYLPLRKWWWAAAAGLLLLGSGLYFFTNLHTATELVAKKTDIPPGTNKAVLTLADGTQVALDSSGHQLIQPGVTQHNGELKYDAAPAGKEMTYNVLTTPRGGQFRLVLPDNSAVWLNAASSIRYATAFSGKEREVIVTGEAYFEVAPLAGQPFRVSLPSGVSVEVLGTHFNVNAYTDENRIRTTLTDGRIQVVQGSDKILLSPGQQATANQGAGIRVKELTPAALAQVIAWKNGIFDFENADLEEAMRQIARWYDVEVIYKGKAPHRIFGGQLSRNLHLADIVEVMRMMKVNVHIEEGKKLVVQPS